MLSLIVPVFRNESSLPALLEAVEGIHLQMEGRFETIFVVDGSPDRCYEILRDSLPDRRFSSGLLLLSRNFGSFAAIRAGMEAAKGDYMAVMAADLQEPPDLIVTMSQILRNEPADVVVGVRSRRGDPLLSRIASGVFWFLYRRFVVPEIPRGGVDVFACNRAFRDQLLQLEERHSSLIAQIFWLGFRRRTVVYQRLKRRHGTSSWTLKKKVNYFLDSVFAFTDLPINLLIWIGGGTAVLSGIFAVLIIIARLFGQVTVPGYAATIVAIVFLGALNLFALGVVGSYAWRTYENTKARPLHIVLRQHHFDSAGLKERSE